MGTLPLHLLNESTSHICSGGNAEHCRSLPIHLIALSVVVDVNFLVTMGGCHVYYVLNVVCPFQDFIARAQLYQSKLCRLSDVRLHLYGVQTHCVVRDVYTSRGIAEAFDT